MVVSEGASSKDDAVLIREALAEVDNAKGKKHKEAAEAHLAELETQQLESTVKLTRQLENLTRLESRLTILGYLQRGGTPSAADRLLASRLGTACAELIDRGIFGVMVVARGWRGGSAARSSSGQT